MPNGGEWKTQRDFNKKYSHAFFEQGKKMELNTGAWQQNYTAVLLQDADDDKLPPIHYISIETNSADGKYSSYVFEIFAIVAALKKIVNLPVRQ
ncbi:hypothetical protein TNCV_1759161 [Trichonephila clavipes]|nr:hypothetical protein TNCV_1759161 [Trichonephila clavipes]